MPTCCGMKGVTIKQKNTHSRRRECYPSFEFWLKASLEDDTCKRMSTWLQAEANTSRVFAHTKPASSIQGGVVSPQTAT